jgi:formylglycine-generating enzyme
MPMNNKTNLMMSNRHRKAPWLFAGMAVLLVAATCLWAAAPATVPVGDVSNANDTTGFGSVNYTYQIGVNEVTRAEYADFLNAVAASDPHGLYNPNMGITRTGSSGSYIYSATDGSRPVAWVSYYDTLRFANWLHNGQPSGALGAASTENGAYTFTGETSVGERNPDAQVFLPNENEWYKAAYYEGGSSAGYWTFPTRSNTLPLASSPIINVNAANYNRAVNDVTAVGSYTTTQGYYGTYDQAGNLWEWNEALIDGDRGVRGGSYIDYALLLQSSYRDSQDPSEENEFVGFRIAASSLNHAPVAAAESYTVDEASTLTVPAPGVLANDTDADGNALTAVLIAGPVYGSLTLNANGAFAYTPTVGYTGTDSFRYKPNDGLTDGNTVTVTINVQPVQPVLYTVTVVNGSGSGSYPSGTVVAIQAAAAPAGQVFDSWTGNTSILADANSASTTLTVPQSTTTVTAVYKNDPVPVTALSITLAQWNSGTQYLTVRGKGSAGKTVVITTRSGSTLGTRVIPQNGTWTFRVKLSSRQLPSRVRATSNGVTVEMPVTRISRD